MASEREPAPEKQLLNLIENPESGSVQQAVIRRAGFSLFSWGAFKGRFFFFKEKLKNLLSLRREPLDIKKINGILCLGIFILAVYFVTSFTVSLLSLEKNSNLSLKIKASNQDRILEAFSPLKKLAYYLEMVRGRNIFIPQTGETEIDEEGIRRLKQVSRISEKSEGLKLVGISWKDDPDVMIEDTKSKRVYFLKKGETINGIKIEAIFKDKVVLNYEGEELILR